jgi:hypothetical protein
VTVAVTAIRDDHATAIRDDHATAIRDDHATAIRDDHATAIRDDHATPPSNLDKSVIRPQPAVADQMPPRPPLAPPNAFGF